MNEAQERVDIFCKNCGTTFSAFLKQMAEHNQKVVCPKCGQAHSYMPSAFRPFPPDKAEK